MSDDELRARTERNMERFNIPKGTVMSSDLMQWQEMREKVRRAAGDNFRWCFPMDDVARAEEALVEAMARAMAPRLFSDPDKPVGPGTKAQRDLLRGYARAALAAVARVRLDATCAADGCDEGLVGELGYRDLCPSCGGSGSSPGSLAVVEWLKAEGAADEMIASLVASGRLECMGGYQHGGDRRYIYDEPEDWEDEAGICVRLFRVSESQE